MRRAGESNPALERTGLISVPSRHRCRAGRSTLGVMADVKEMRDVVTLVTQLTMTAKRQ